MDIQEVLNEAKKNAPNELLRDVFTYFDTDLRWETLPGDESAMPTYLIIVEDKDKKIRCFASGEGYNLDEVTDYIGPYIHLTEYMTFNKSFHTGKRTASLLVQQIRFERDSAFLPPMPHPAPNQDWTPIHDWLDMAEADLETLEDLGEEDYFSAFYPKLRDPAKSHLISREKTRNLTQYRVFSPAPRYLTTVTTTLQAAKLYIDRLESFPNYAPR